MMKLHRLNHLGWIIAPQRSKIDLRILVEFKKKGECKSRSNLIPLLTVGPVNKFTTDHKNNELGQISDQRSSFQHKSQKNDCCTILLVIPNINREITKRYSYVENLSKHSILIQISFFYFRCYNYHKDYFYNSKTLHFASLTVRPLPKLSWEISKGNRSNLESKYKMLV